MVSDAREVPQRAAVTAAMFSAACMIAQHVGGKTARDALFLSNFGRGALAGVMFGSAALSFVGVLAMSRTLARAEPARAVPFAYAASAALFVGEWALAGPFERAAATALYLHLAVLGGVTISGFWSVVNERFDPHAAKDAIRRITGGAAFGGAVGGLLAERTGALFGLRSLLLVLAGLNVLCAAGIVRMGRPRAVEAAEAPADAAPRRAADTSSGLQILREVPYLRHMGALVALTGGAAALADYAFKTEAAAWLPGGSALVAFFAVFYAASDLLTLVFQATLSGRALHRLGLGGTMAILPGAMLVTSLLGAAVTRLWSVLLVRATTTSLTGSFFRSGYELLYTPLSPRTKRPTKTFVDVACDRLGDMGGSALALFALAVAPVAAVSLVIAFIAVASAAALWICHRLHGEYVAALADGLRSGAIEIADEDVADATTRATLTTTTLALDRERLLAQIERLTPEPSAPGTSAGEPATPDEVGPDEGARDEVPTSGPRSSGPRSGRLLSATADLLSGDRERIVAALAPPFDPRLVAHAIPLLARADVKQPALDALRDAAPRAIGQLADALLDPQVPALVRARVPRALEVCDAPRAVIALLEGLGDDRFEVRGRCAEALGRIRRRRPDLALPQAVIFEAVERELQADRAPDGEARDARAGADAPARPDREHGHAHRVLEHVFGLLALTLDPEPLALTLRALVAGDGALRGTALEYLDNVLPDPIRGALQAYLAEEPPRPPPSRPRAPHALADELRRTLR